MTPQELSVVCSSFEPTRHEPTILSDFARIVQNSFSMLGLYQRDLADDFEVAESTISRWGNGLARPHPQIQRRVVAWIGKRAAKMASAAGNASSAAAPHAYSARVRDKVAV
jgi:ribosome-binding protein aMBF1 (putative translation factor)